MQDTQRHRHFVALPLMALCMLGLSGLDHAFSATVLATQNEAVRAVHATVLQRDAGFFTVQSGFGLSAETVSGTLYAVSDDASATVAAVEGTAIASLRGSLWVLPAGYQLRTDAEGNAKRSAAPMAWIREQRELARSLPSDSVPVASVNLQWILDRLASDAVPDLVFAVPAIASSMLRPLPEELLSAWVKATKKSAVHDPRVTADVLASSIDQLPDRYEAAGYPKQAILWRSALTEIQPFLPLTTAIVLTNPKPEPMQKARQYTDDELVALTRSILTKHAVLFTTVTSVTVDSQRIDCARVDGVFIADQGRDAAYAFSYCPASSMIKGIAKDGTPLPNDVPITVFFAQ